MKSFVLTLSLLTLIGLLATTEVLAQAYYYNPRPNYPVRKSWYTARPAPKTRNQTKPTVPVVVLTPAEAAAKAELDRLGAELSHAEGIQYDAVIGYPIGEGSKVQMKQATVSTSVERYVRLLIQATNDGQTEGVISADGEKFTLYDAPKNSYVQISTSKDLFSLQQALELGGKQIYPKQTNSGRDLRAALEFPMLFLEGVFDEDRIPAGDSLTYTKTSSTTADSKPVDLVTATLTSPKTGTVAAAYMIDPATNLPVEFTQIDTKPGKSPVFDIQETFKNFKLLHKTLDSSTYSYNVPADATLAPAEALSANNK